MGREEKKKESYRERVVENVEERRREGKGRERERDRKRKRVR